MYDRVFNISKLLEHRSVFLFGPRQVGKSTFLQLTFPGIKYFNLLKADTFSLISGRPESIRQSLTEADRIVIIDEVQKLPLLLDEVQAVLLERPDVRFILTGSSARKLKRGGANLLAGRALVQRVHPLSYPEMRSHFSDFNSLHLLRCNRGGLPPIVDSPFPEEDLRAYVGTYLQEEILSEGLSRGIESFARFLQVVATTNGQQINFTSVANDVGVSPRIIKSYYTILEDTLIGHLLPSYQKTVKRKTVASPKFYLFDIGITNELLRRGRVSIGNDSYGNILEHLIFLELRTFLDYHRRREELTYWRSRSQIEVDFLIGDDIALEVKSSGRIAPKDERGLLALGEEIPKLRKILVCHEPLRRKLDSGIEVIPLNEFFEDLWNGEIL
jgi:uncharacterized protein